VVLVVVEMPLLQVLLVRQIRVVAVVVVMVSVLLLALAVQVL
jgi:hypothetical protein